MIKIKKKLPMRDFFFCNHPEWFSSYKKITINFLKSFIRGIKRSIKKNYLIRSKNFSTVLDKVYQ